MTVYSSVAVERLERRIEDLEAQLSTTRQALMQAGVVIERMANGAPREECDPELTAVIRALADTGGDTKEPA